jgi:hypothetical protein
MKLLLIVASAFTCLESSFAQAWKTPTTSDFPTLIKDAKDVRSFIPKNWNVVARADGDLNSDRLPDTVLIVRGSLQKFLWKDQYLSDYFDTNPRILMIIFQTRAKTFRLVESSNTFIIPPDNPSMEEPFKSVRIKKGVLNFSFTEWYSSGTWYTADRTYRFKLLGGQFKLIGADKSESMRNSGEVETRSYNFITDRLKLTISNYDKKVRPRSKWRHFDIGPLKTFRSFPKPFEWEIEPDYYL